LEHFKPGTIILEAMKKTILVLYLITSTILFAQYPKQFNNGIKLNGIKANANPTRLPILDGEGVINEYVNVVDLTKELNVLDENSIQQFSVTNELQFKGFTFNNINNEIEANEIKRYTYFIDYSNGNDTNGKYENANFPFKNLQAAINHSRIILPIDNTRPPEITFEIRDNATHILDKPIGKLVNSDVRVRYKIVSSLSPEIRIENNTTDILRLMTDNEDWVKSRVMKLTINAPLATLSFYGSGDINLSEGNGGNPPVFGVVDINVDTITYSSSGAKHYIYAGEHKSLRRNLNLGSSVIKANTVNVISNCAVRAISENSYIYFKNINYESNSGILISVFYGSFEFDNIEASSPFLITTTNSSKLIHGNIRGNYSGEGFRYISTNRSIEIIYKNNPIIDLPVYMGYFNSPPDVPIKLIGTSVKYNSPYLFSSSVIGVAAENNIMFDIEVSNLEVSGSLFSEGRQGAGVRITNTYLKLGGKFNGVFSAASDSNVFNAFRPIILEVNGNCVINCATSPNEKVIFSYSEPPSGKPIVQLNGNLSIINGTIDETTVEVVKPSIVNVYSIGQ